MVKILLLVLLGGCTLFDDPPKNACKSNSDCFRAQNEHCDLNTHQCAPGDAGVDAP
jgi:hypothetical protein